MDKEKLRKTMLIIVLNLETEEIITLSDILNEWRKQK
jgi:hypothetical protein